MPKLRKKLLSTWRLPPPWIVENCCFDHVNSVRMRFYSVQLSHKSAEMAPKYRRKKFDKASDRHVEFAKFRFVLSNDHPQNRYLHLCTKFDRNRMIRGWDMKIKLFSKWWPSAISNMRKLPFWSCDLHLHVILHLRSKFRIIIIIIIIERVWFMWHRLNSYKTTLQCHDESLSNSSSSHVQLELYHASGKLRENSSLLSSCLKAGRVVDEITSTGRAFQHGAEILPKTIFNMSSVHHFEFVITFTSSYCIIKLHFMFPTLC